MRNVLIANEIMADGEFRAGGKIYPLSEATAEYLVSLGKGRIPTDEEVARLGVAGVDATTVAAAPVTQDAKDDAEHEE